MFSKPAIKQILAQYVRVQLYTDKVPPQLLPAPPAEENRKLLTDEFKTAQLPLYVILRPSSDGKYEEVSRYVEGKINNVDAFIDFLRKPLDERLAAHSN